MRFRPEALGRAVGAALLVWSQAASAAQVQKVPARKPPPAPAPSVLEGKGALEPFFRALSAISAGGAARVLHFGDSHVAADYWTGELRRLLQEKYGDAGPGFVMPGNPWIGFRHAQVRSFSTGGWETLGLSRETLDGMYGRSGTALSPTGAEGSAGVEAVFSNYRVELLTLSVGACIAISIDGVTQFAGLLDPPDPGDSPEEACCRLTHEAVPDAPAVFVTVANSAPLDPVLHRLEIRDACGGLTRIFGVELGSGRPGVAVDTLGLNGAELPALGKWLPGVRRAVLRSSEPSLVVVSYGTNDMGRGDFDFDDYRTRASELLRSLREDVPGAAILVTGPIDRGARKKKGSAVVAKNAPLVTRALRDAAAATGCAFWDAAAAMGGSGSIRRWAKEGKAQRDLVHLTGSGYARLAGLLVERIVQAEAEWRAAR